MARYLEIKHGVAVNAIEVAGPADFPQWTLIQSDSADIGDLWDGQVFTKPAPVVKVPKTVTPRQGRAILITRGHLAQIQGMLDAMTGIEGELARNDFASAQEWLRTWPLIEQMRAALGWTCAYVDELFVAAAKL